MKLAIHNGRITAIYSDELAGLIEQAKTCSIRRASNVEPTADGQWEARMVDDGVVLGPFRLRGDALAAEVRYLEDQLRLTCSMTDAHSQPAVEL